MFSALKISRQQLLSVNWEAVVFFYAVACGLSYGLHFLPNLNPWFLPRHDIFTYGLGPMGAALLARRFFGTLPRTITWAGIKTLRTALFVAVPLVVGFVVGLTNTSGQNPHVYGALVVLSGVLYGFVEEVGWRGFLLDALRPLPVFWRAVLIGTLWLCWHFTFLSDFSAIAGPNVPFLGLYAGFIVLSWASGAAADRTKAVLVVACLHEAGNLVNSPVALGVIVLCWTLLLVFWNRPVPRFSLLTPKQIFFLVLVWLTTPAIAFAQSDSPFTPIPHQELKLDQPNSFALFDDAFYENRLFLLGEVHGFQKPQELDFALLKYLNERVGVRYYVAEVDAVKAHYLNDYLNTGDTTTLDAVFNSWITEPAQWANRDFYRKIQRIRALNQTLPPARRIRFVGIDRIQDKPLTAQCLTELLRGRNLSSPTRLLADSLLNGLRANRPDSVVANRALTWLAYWKTASGKPNRLSGRDTAELRHLLTNVAYLKTIRSREKIIFTNFQTLLSSLNNEKLYGFWGFFHVLQQPPLKSVKPFACLVRESGVSVASITCSYVDCVMMMPNRHLVKQFNNNGPMMKTDGIDDMIAQSKPNSATLFRLTGTPAGQQPFRVTYSPFMPASQQMQCDPSRPTTDYFQYVILVRNSPATEPLIP